jgi:hypothetical protein
VNVIRENMWDFIEIEFKALDQNLSVEGKSAGAEFGAWIMFLFEEQDSGRKLRSDPLEM